MPFDKVSGKIENMARKACSICFIFTLGYVHFISLESIDVIVLQEHLCSDDIHLCPGSYLPPVLALRRF